MIELILIFKIVVAVIALETKNLLSAVIALGGVGFGLAIIMLFLGAPDVAIVQILVEVVLLVILIRATISIDITLIKGKKEIFTKIVGVSLASVLFLGVLFVIADLPPLGLSLSEQLSFNVPSLGYLRGALTETGSPNVVTAILLDYRAYDTLGEATVLFTAIIGVMVILRKTKKQEERIKDYAKTEEKTK